MKLFLPGNSISLSSFPRLGINPSQLHWDLMVGGFLRIFPARIGRRFLLLEEISTPKLCPVRTFSWVCSYSIAKELSLLRWSTLTPSETLCTLLVLDLQQLSKCWIFQTLCTSAKAVSTFFCSDCPLRLQVQLALFLHGSTNPIKLLDKWE